MRGADFCNQCGNCLVPDPAINSSAKTPIDPTAISHLIKSTSNKKQAAIVMADTVNGGHVGDLPANIIDQT